GELLISCDNPSLLGTLPPPCPTRGAALEAVGSVQAHRFMITWQVAAEPIGKRCRVVRQCAYDDRELTRPSNESGLLIMQDPVLRQRQRRLRRPPRWLMLEHGDGLAR